MKHVLLAITGYSPQVITETIYAAKQQLDIEFSDVRVITTEQGKQRIEQALFYPNESGKTVLESLYYDYQITPPNFTIEDVWVPEINGKTLDDVTTEQEVQVCADFVLDKVKRLTDNSEQLFTLMAGGRKTMTFYVGYAMTLYGRYTDTLNHVFVSPEFERSQFFYPPKHKQFISGQGGTFYNTQDAEVHLAKVPYLHMRESLPQKLIKESLSFSQAISFCDSFKYPVELCVDLNTHQLTCSGQHIALSDTDFAFYWMFVHDYLNNRAGFICPPAEQASEVLALEYLNARGFLFGLGKNKFKSLEDAVEYLSNSSENVIITEKELKSLAKGMKKTWFNSRKNSIKEALYHILPPTLAEHYDIDFMEKVERGDATKKVSVQSLSLDRDQFKIKEAVLNESQISDIAAKQWPI